MLSVKEADLEVFRDQMTVHCSWPGHGGHSSFPTLCGPKPEWKD